MTFEKQTIRQRLCDIEKLKAENKRLEELLAKWNDKGIQTLIKENRELRQQNRELMEDNIKLKLDIDLKDEEIWMLKFKMDSLKEYEAMFKIRNGANE